ncbi:MAG: type II toxin-antitoxin system VapB family antitoxin [Candidatus Latescibacterota bacterium]
MRTNIVIDDQLMMEAMRLSGSTTKRAVVDQALRALIQLCRQEQIRSLRGRLRWEGDLEEMRRDR